MKSILIIVPYDNIYPPMNGGMQRCFHIMHQLAKQFKLTAIIHQDKNEFLKSAVDFPAIACVNIYSTKDYKVKDLFTIFPSRIEKALRYRWYQKNLRGPANENYLLYYPLLKPSLQTERFDLIILENLVTLNAIGLIRRYDRDVKIVYDAHNVETNLAKAALSKNEITPERLNEIKNTETNLYKNVDAIFACSDDDKEAFLKMNKDKLKVITIPNGANVPVKKYDDGVNEQIPGFLIFCGSLWSKPNAEGLYWFCKKIWPLVLNGLPGLKLLVVGFGNLPKQYSEAYKTPSVEFVGEVNDVKPWYNKAAISVVPLLTGSGTRLKILEAMGLGVPVISTSVGAEGIAYTDGGDILIADNEQVFAEKIIQLARCKKERLKIQENALKLVKKIYDWNVIGRSMAEFINN